MTKHIGIAGVSPEGAALCYRQIFRHAAHRLDPHDHPIVTIHNLPLADYIDAIKRDDWHAVGGMLRTSAEKLASLGAEFVFTPDNAVQHGIPLACVGSPIPWLNMTEIVADAIAADGRTCVGIIGTLTVTEGSTYQTHLGMRGIKIERPSHEEAQALEDIIFGELVFGEDRVESQAVLMDIIRSLEERGAEGVILAYSEAGMLLASNELPLPYYESVELMANRVLSEAIAD